MAYPLQPPAADCAPRGRAQRPALHGGEPSVWCRREGVRHASGGRRQGARGQVAAAPPVLGGLLLGLGLLALLLAVQRWRGPQVAVLRVRRAPLVQRVVASGRVLPPAVVSVGTQVAGRVVEVAVDEGARVEAGALLLALDGAAQAAELARARAGLATARARRGQLLAVSAPQQAQALRRAEVELAQAERNVERTRELQAQGVATRAQLDDAQAALALAQSQQQAASTQAQASGRGGAERQLAEAAVAQAEAEVAAAEARFEQTRLVAPGPALVLRRDVEPGDAVQPGRTLLTLVRRGRTRLSVEPDERNLAFLRPGQRALASAEAFPAERFEAVVESLAPGVDPTRGTVEVKLAVPRPPAYLRPDMTVSVDVEVGRREGVLVLPVEWVRDAASEHPWALVARGGRARRAELRLGLQGEAKVEVVEGLSEGDLVLSPAAGVEAGARVRPQLAGGEG